MVIIPCDIDSDDDRFKEYKEQAKEKVPEMDRDTVLFNQRIQEHLDKYANEKELKVDPIIRRSVNESRDPTQVKEAQE